MGENEEKLLIHIEAKDDASSVLQKVEGNLKKFGNSGDTTKYLTSQIASFTAQMRKANEETKAYLKQVNALLRQKTNISLPTKQVAQPNQIEGSKTKEVLDNETGSITKYTQALDEMGNTIKRVYKDTDTSPKTTTTIFAKPRQEIQGNIISQDTEKGIIKTKEITENGEEIVRTYKSVIKDGERWIGVLNSSLTKIKQIRKESEQEEKNDNTPKKESALKRIGKIFQSIIAFRLASGVITLVINAFKKGFEAISQSSKSVRDSLQSFNTSTTAISVSLATIFIPIVQSLATVLEPLADHFIQVANAISLSNAQSKGQTEYFKLSKDAIERYSKSLKETNNQLTQLDKFATLTGKKNIPLGEMVEINDKTIQEQLDESKPAQDTIAFFKTLTTVLEGVAWFINFISGEIGQILLVVGAGLLSFLSPVFAVITAINTIITLFSDASWFAKALAGVLLAVASAFLIMRISAGAIGLGTALVIGGVIGAGVGLVGSLVSSATSSTGASIPTTNSNQNSFTNGINDLTSTYSSQSQSLKGNVYIDGTVAGQVLAPNVYNSGKKIGVFK